MFWRQWKNISLPEIHHLDVDTTGASRSDGLRYELRHPVHALHLPLHPGLVSDDRHTELSLGGEVVPG